MAARALICLLISTEGRNDVPTVSLRCHRVIIASPAMRPSVSALIKGINMPDETITKALVNIELTKPLTKLIEVVSSGIGTLYEPTKIRRLAHAEVERDVLKTKAEIAKTDLMQRASQRLMYTETKRQENIESIIRESIKFLPEKVSDEQVGESWAMNFFDGCKDVTDSEVQGIWGRILAGETAKPGKYHRKTVNMLKNLDSDDARLVANLGNSCWSFGERVFPVITKEMRTDAKHNAITFEQYLHLQSLGIISLNEQNMFVLINQHREIDVWYENWHRLVFPADNYKFSFSCAVLTVPGTQLVDLCKHDVSEQYLAHILETWVNAGIQISCVYPRV